MRVRTQLITFQFTPNIPLRPIHSSQDIRIPHFWRNMSTLPSTMKAAVIHTPGGPSAFQVEAVPVPTPKPGWVLIRTRAFGLNRSVRSLPVKATHPLD